jgi:predicted dehydrogenase
MKVWLVDKWIDVPMPHSPPSRGVLLDVAYSAVLDEQFSTHSKQKPLKQIVDELLGKPELVIKWGGYLVKEGPRATLKKIAARMDDVHIATQKSCCSVSGRVEVVGSSVEDLKPGERVAGLGFLAPGHAEFVVVPEELCIVLPDGVSQEQAAFILPGAMALYAVERLLDMEGEGPVAVLGDTSWGILAAQELQSRGEEVIQQSGRDSLPKIMKSCDRFILAHPEFLQYLSSNGKGKSCVAIHNKGDDPIQYALAAGWALENIKFPDPANEKRDNLDIYSDDPLDIPPWAKREYIERFIERLVQGKLQPAVTLTAADDYCAGEKISRLISYPAEKSRDRCLNNPAPQPVSSRKQLGVSIVGAGNFAQHMHIPLLLERPEIRFRGIVDMEPYQSYYVAKFNGFDFFSTDPANIFADKQTDCVFVVTYHDSHAPLAIDALRAGKSVFMEKPPVVNYEQLADLAEAIKTYDEYLTVGYNRRYAPATLSFTHLLANIEGPTNLSYNVRSWNAPPNNWYYWKKEGTRICGNLCHFIDLCYFLTGRQRPVSVTVIPSTVGRPDCNYTATISFQDGSLGSIVYSNKGNNCPEGEERINFQRGGLTVIVDDWQRMHARENGQVVARWSGKERDQGHKNLLLDTIRDIQHGKPSPYTLEDLVVTSLVMLKAKESMEKKETVTVTPEEINSYL